MSLIRVTPESFEMFKHTWFRSKELHHSSIRFQALPAKLLVFCVQTLHKENLRASVFSVL